MAAILELRDIRQKVSDLASQYGAERIFLFGSYARGEATVDSDIDLRIDRGHIKGWALGGLLIDLELIIYSKETLRVRKNGQSVSFYFIAGFQRGLKEKPDTVTDFAEGRWYNINHARFGFCRIEILNWAG